MKIAFIGFEDITDPFLWSGIPFTLYHKFKASTGVNVQTIRTANIKVKFPISVLLKRFVYNKLLAYKFGVYRFDREFWCIKAYSATINKEIAAFNPDVILCCNAYQIIDIKTTKPIFIYTDATFKLLNTYYTDYMRYCNTSVKQAQIAENLAFKKAKGIIFSSNWAKKSAVNDYLISEEKINIIPFGSNLKLPSHYQLKLEKKISRDYFSLIFVGYDHERKGLKKAIEIQNRLILKGVNCRLTVIGPSVLPQEFKSEKINFLGKLEMKKPKDCEKLLNAYDDAHFLILPTNVEAFGIVFCEAASLAVPSITHSVGGVDEIIKNNINGIKLPLESMPDQFVEKLLLYIDNSASYQNLRKTTHQEYAARLNWDNTVNQILAIFANSIK